MAGGRFVDPLNPFCDVNVSVVEPDLPGLAMLTVAGVAVTAKFPPTSIVADGEVEAAKLESPLY